MGMTWGAGLKNIFLPVYEWMDSKTLRKFAEDHIYTKEKHCDYCLISLLLIVNTVATLCTVFYYQLRFKELPYWLIAAYYCSWVGVGGRTMGAAYTLAHREGHSSWMYKTWIKQYIGNFFENYLGLFYGNIPWNFTTSHVFIHHKLAGSMGDTFYLWDLDRTRVSNFLLYISRVFPHLTGTSSIKHFMQTAQPQRAGLLREGQWIFTIVGLAILGITRSAHFTFWIYLQPFLGMNFFLALINIGFHGFLELDEQGNHNPFVDSTTIVDGDDDYFGEDDHMAHHHAPQVYHRDLAKHQASLRDTYAKNKASVFRSLSIIELSVLIIFNAWDRLADHYVDYSGTMTKQDIKDMLMTRARRTEISTEKYHEFLDDPALVSSVARSYNRKSL
jgi:hypothetical protein